MRINPPDAMQLRSFAKLAEVGTFVRAANELEISQPSLSRHIKSLEDQFGVRLFDRDTRKVVLSAAGSEVLLICRRMLAEIDSSVAEIAAVVSGRRGRVTIAALPSPASALLPQAILRMRALSPDVEIRLIDGDLEEVEKAVMLGHADFGLTAEPIRDEILRFRHLIDDPMLALLFPHDPDATLSEIGWAELAAKPFIAIGVGTSIQRMADLGFGKAGVVVSPSVKAGFVRTAATLVAAGLGATAIPRLFLTECMDLNTIAIPLVRPLIERRIGIITAVDRPPSPAAQLLIAQIIEAAAVFVHDDASTRLMNLAVGTSTATARTTIS